MADSPTKRKTVSEKLADCKKVARMGVEEMALELNLKHPDLTNKECRELVEELFDLIQVSLKSGRNVIIRGFGSFQCRSRKARRIHIPSAAKNKDANPWKEVPSSTAFRFKAGTEMKPIFNKE